MTIVDARCRSSSLVVRGRGRAGWVGGGPRRRALAPAEELGDLLADPVQGEAQRRQRLGGHALALAEQAEQDVLGADVVVAQDPGLFLSQDNNAPRPVGKP